MIVSANGGEIDEICKSFVHGLKKGLPVRIKGARSDWGKSEGGRDA